MTDLNNIINKFIEEEITLDKKDISESAKSREWFLKKLKKKIEEDENTPFLYKEKPFIYFGSYFKGTKVNNVDEFDVLVVIDSLSGTFTSSGVSRGQGLGVKEPNPKYNGQYNKTDMSGVSPIKILNWLKKITEEISEPYNGIVPEKDGEAITVEIKSKNLKIDLVPAGIFKDSNGDEFFNIHNGTNNGGWTLTNPETDKDLINELSKDRNNFKNIIRLLKFIRDKYNFKISSFAIECVVIDYVENNEWKNKISDDFILVLSHLYKLLGKKYITDIFDGEVNLINELDDSVSEWYTERIKKIIVNIISIANTEDEAKRYDKISGILNNSSNDS